ncbi:MAG: hypothetical protein AABZ80_00425 [Gemmatimonadota bacterium]
MSRFIRQVRAGLTAVIATAVSSSAAAQAGQTALPFTDAAWSFRGDSIRAEPFEGRASLGIRNGFAYRRDVRFEDGTIDVDVMTTRKRSFVYVMFRMQTDSGYEDFYIRPHKSGAPDALQYAPVYQQNSAWQLYHGADGTASAEIEPGVWTRLRIVLRGRQAAIFLGDTTKPALLIPRLGHEPRAGYLALRGFLPAGVAVSGPVVRFANVRIRPGHIPFAFPASPERAATPGIVPVWMIGEPFVATDSLINAIPAGATARMNRVEALSNGLVELHRLVPLKPGMRNVGALARLMVAADSAGVYRMDLGFSDKLTAFVNGRAIFHRDDAYDYGNRRDGLVGYSQATVFLPLRAGNNILEFVVTDVFGGWGLMGRFPDMRGLRVVEP